MARWTAWMPLALGAALVGGVVALSRFAAERVDRGLRGVARRLPEMPDEARPELGDPAIPGDEPGAFGGQEGEEREGADDEPRLDLEHPSERDWRFLEQTVREGPPEARRSAAKALVIAGDLRGARPLLQQAAVPGADADLYCYAALEILRLQRWEDALPVLLGALLSESAPPSPTCRAELADRFVVAGGRDPERLGALAASSDPLVRSFVAGYLAEVSPDEQRAVLERLALDADPLVRQRAGGVSAPVPPVAP